MVGHGHGFLADLGHALDQAAERRRRRPAESNRYEDGDGRIQTWEALYTIIVAYFALWISGKDVEKTAGNAKIANKSKLQTGNCKARRLNRWDY